jgi:hypothetical protein
LIALYFDVSFCLKYAVFLDITPCGSCETDVSEKCITSFIKATRIGELATTMEVTSNRSMLLAIHCMLRLLVTAKFVHSLPVLVAKVTERYFLRNIGFRKATL